MVEKHFISCSVYENASLEEPFKKSAIYAADFYE